MAKTQTTKGKAAKNSGSKKTAVKAAAKKASTASMKKNAADKTTDFTNEAFLPKAENEITLGIMHRINSIINIPSPFSYILLMRFSNFFIIASHS